MGGLRDLSVGVDSIFGQEVNESDLWDIRIGIHLGDIFGTILEQPRRFQFFGNERREQVGISSHRESTNLQTRDRLATGRDVRLRYIKYVDIEVPCRTVTCVLDCLSYDDNLACAGSPLDSPVVGTDGNPSNTGWC